MSTISASTTSTTAFKITTDTTGALVFQTGSSPTTAVTFDASQNVGIGTSSPTAGLQINRTSGQWVTLCDATSTTNGDKTVEFRAAKPGTSYLNLSYIAYQHIWGSGASPSAQLTLDASGNLGIGVTPSAWASSLSGTIENLSGGLYPYHPGGGTYDIGLFVNAYYDGSWRYKNTGSASARYIMGVTTSATSAGHYWGIAGTGTAGNPITFTEAMVLNGSGNLGIGTTNPGVRLDVVGTGATLSGTAKFVGRFVQDTTNYRGVAFGYDSSGQIGLIYPETASAASNLAFWTYSGSAWAERARITSTGNVTKPYNACFLVDRSGSQNPYSAGNAIVFNSAVFDQNSNFNTSTGVFTAPVTGKYLLSATILVQGSSTGAEYDLSLVTSNRSYYGAPGRIEYQLGTSWGDGYIAMQVTQIVDMDTSDTAYVTFTTFGAGYIYGGSGWTRFSGCLIS